MVQKIISKIIELVIKAQELALSNRSSNEISHVGFSEEWAKVHGKVMHQG